MHAELITVVSPLLTRNLTMTPGMAAIVLRDAYYEATGGNDLLSGLIRNCTRVYWVHEGVHLEALDYGEVRGILAGELCGCMEHNGTMALVVHESPQLYVSYRPSVSACVLDLVHQYAKTIHAGILDTYKYAAGRVRTTGMDLYTATGTGYAVVGGDHLNKVMPE